MKVKALEVGFFNGSRVRAGQVFEVPEGTKGSWFVPVGDVKATDAPKPAGKGKPKKDEPQTLSAAAHQEVQTFAEAHAEAHAEAGDMA